MKYFMFVDDDVFNETKERDPHVYYKFLGKEEMITKMESFEHVVKVSSVEDAMKEIEKNGCPTFISFDNDLQRELEGIHLAHWIVDKDLDSPGFIPSDFDFVVHSQNNIASGRIVSYLESYLKQREPAIAKVNNSPEQGENNLNQEVARRKHGL